jgi:deoxyribonuclease (pyrimidine dimer)
MTRINSNIPVSKLHRTHLIAELREITMVPAALRRSLASKSAHEVLNSIPKKFTLNAGHVKFFYDKLEFLQYRFIELCEEMTHRGYTPDETRISAFSGFDKMWYNDWDSTPQDDSLVVERIQLRISQKPHLYQDVLV